MGIIVIVDKDVAKRFGIELDETQRPVRGENGKIVTTKPKSVPSHIQDKMISFLDMIESARDNKEIMNVIKTFKAEKPEPSPYVKRMIDKVRDLLFKIYRIDVDKDKVRLLKARLSRDYRVTFGITRKKKDIRVFILVVDGGKREGYYDH